MKNDLQEANTIYGQNKMIAHKTAYIFAGVNGAGKSTLYWNEVEKGARLGQRINIDEIVSSFGDWRDSKDQARAARIALKLQKAILRMASLLIKKLHFVAKVFCDFLID